MSETVAQGSTLVTGQGNTNTAGGTADGAGNAGAAGQSQPGSASDGGQQPGQPGAPGNQQGSGGSGGQQPGGAQAQQGGEQTNEGGGEGVKPDQVPDKYELNLPDDSVVDVEKISALAKGLGLSNEQAQQLADHQHKAITEHLEQTHTQFAQQVEQWKADVQADKEIGGQAFDASVSAARQAIDKFATPAFKQALDETGFGNHPEVVRVFARIGKAMAEDQGVTARQNTADDPVDPAEKLYGNSNKQG